MDTEDNSEILFPVFTKTYAATLIRTIWATYIGFVKKYYQIIPVTLFKLERWPCIRKLTACIRHRMCICIAMVVVIFSHHQLGSIEVWIKNPKKLSGLRIQRNLESKEIMVPSANSYDSSANRVWFRSLIVCSVVLMKDIGVIHCMRFADWCWPMKSRETLNWLITNVSSKSIKVGLIINHSQKLGYQPTLAGSAIMNYLTSYEVTGVVNQRGSILPDKI